jgi:hypothetical protein
MIASTHTPGPWRLVSNEQDRSFHIVGADSLPVCTINTTISSTSAKWSNKKLDAAELWASVSSDTEARNARLITAAPDLLAVAMELEESAAYWSEYDVPLGIVDRIRAATAKAGCR